MKTILLSSILSLIILQGAVGSELSISSKNNALFYVKLDNNIFSSYSTKAILANLPSGRHKIEIFKYFEGYGGQVFAKKVGVKNLHVPENTRIVAVVDPHNQIRIVELQPIIPVVVDAYPNHEPGCGFHMSNHEFELLRKMVKNESFDSSRLKIAKQAISGNGVTAQMVRDLMNEMSFESNKLELAKFAFKHTTNKNMYFLVNSAFTFESSKRELEKFISNSF